MKVALGADHGGFETKEAVKELLVRRGVDVDDFGCHKTMSVDYSDYAREVASRVSSNAVEQGVLVCTTGIGMSMAANKWPRVRAALCLTPRMARMARTHNDANILVLAGDLGTSKKAAAILDEWLKHRFSGEERHVRRLGKITTYCLRAWETEALFEEDSDICDAIDAEVNREQSTIDLVASENYASRAVREAQGSAMTNKYAEGYPGKRWYSGCECVDVVEQLAIDRAKKLFGAEHANVQPHSGSSANMAVYFAALAPGDTILAMSLAHGGHLTHGYRLNFSGRFFKVVAYGVSETTEQIDYDTLAKLAAENEPKLIVAGASAYPRVLDFERIRSIADNVRAQLMVDIAHIAGLVAAGSHPSPVPYAEFVTSTTHKTLRGPRSGIILCRKEFAEDIDRQVFPGIQGGPQMHTIAAKAVCFREAMTPEFKKYSEQIVRNARAMATALSDEGLRIVSGGTDNHLMLADVTATGITGDKAASVLERAGITVNKNAIPFDPKSPLVASGIRIGTPAVTTRGMKESEMRTVAAMIGKVLRDVDDEANLKKVRGEVEELTSQFPIP